MLKCVAQTKYTYQSLLQQSAPPTWCCPPCASGLGWCSLACKPTPFSSKHNDGHYGKTVKFLFHQTREHFSKKYDLCPHVQLKTVVWLFYGGFGAVDSFLQSGLSDYVDIDTFVPVSSSVFTRSFAACSGIDLHLFTPKYIHL